MKLSNDNNLNQEIDLSNFIEKLGKGFGLNKWQTWIAIVLLFLSMTYFHPSSEVLICDSNHSCKVEHTYFNHIKFSRNIKFKPDYVTCKNTEIRKGRRRYEPCRRISLNDNLGSKIEPFIYCYKMDFGNCEYENQYYSSYINNPESKYVLQSAADPTNHYFFWGFLCLYTCFLCCAVINFLKKL